MMTEHNDVLVADYLSRVSRATAGLPAEQRDELLRDLQEHIDSGRSELTVETEAQVREILDRLGEPSVIARAAAEDAEPSRYASTTYPPVPHAPTDAKPRSHLPVIIAIGVAVVLLALCAGVLFFASASSTEMPAQAPATPG
ncbi:hypothetical protein HH310_04335 [Actinoplanes sp. TBRC 11911]|uniref:DUF1700 domain-containing protein n=1 Tax=Actinoplanes sp. TBRC 11911 TaxID=2729386 RepID=UPI00145EA1D8|nr:hypothetical protein [Actinoplanes sp. TBRC 11911]NMO50420.1 hypothetical protein [Actinoplanes sp. TBRC 11911]